MNLSSKPLSIEQQNVLELGLKFVPTPKDTPDPVEHFEKFEAQCQRTYSKLLSGYTDKPIPANIKERLQKIKTKLTLLPPNKEFKRNFPPHMRKALYELKNDSELTIKQADKGSCIVVMDTAQYIEEGYAHLSDTSTYKILEEDPSWSIAQEANDILATHHKAGTITNYDLTNSITLQAELRTQRMYFLRKVHKTPHKL